MRLGVISIAMLIVAIRIWMGFNIPPESVTAVDIYKDFAHLFVGGLFVAWYLQRKTWQWCLFWVMNATEIIVAVMSRMGT